MQDDHFPGAIECDDRGCFEVNFDSAAALREGWVQVGEQVFCPSHGMYRQAQARRDARRAQLDDHAREIAAQVRDDEAKRTMTSREYEAWYNFQALVRNFEREQQDLRSDRSFRVCKPLRDLSPRLWLQFYRAGTPVDVRTVQSAADAAPKAKDELLRRAARGVQ